MPTDLNGTVTVRLHGVGVITLDAFTCIVDSFYIAGCPASPAPLPPLFDHVVSLTPPAAYRPTRQPITSTVVAMADAHDQPMHAVDAVAAFVDGLVLTGQPTLVHCAAGLNRSATVAARVLMRRGHTADDAISLVRERRSPHALHNEHFVRWLQSTPLPTT